MINVAVTELANRVYGFVKSVTIDIALLVVILGFWYVLQGSHVIGVILFGSYTFGNLLWLILLGLIGAVLFIIGERVSPLLASVVRERYTGKRVLDWDEFMRAVTRVAILIAVWVLLLSSTKSLVGALSHWISADALLGLYHILFGLAVAYFAVSGAIRCRTPGLKAPESLGGVSWDGVEEAVQISEYLKRLEALKSSGHIDDKIYEKLRSEYESKLRTAIELER